VLADFGPMRRVTRLTASPVGADVVLEAYVREP